MTKYINAAVLYDTVHEIGGCGAKAQTWSDGWDKAIDSVIDIIEDMSAADVQPVKHGQWERRMSKIYACSECTNEVTDRQAKGYQFCPYCGTLMDGGDDNA